MIDSLSDPSNSLLGSATIIDSSPGCFETATPRQPKGPFYPLEPVLAIESDLTHVEGHASRAKGEAVYVTGRVMSRNQGTDQPVAGAIVEIWQACETGKYDHPDDPNTAAIDPDFKYFGRAITGADGCYLFKTIVPGAYPADTHWMRPPHIHFRVAKIGFIELITQMYFEGHPLNDCDEILQMVPKEEQRSVIIAGRKITGEEPASGAWRMEKGSSLFEFDLRLIATRDH